MHAWYCNSTVIISQYVETEATMIVLVKCVTEDSDVGSIKTIMPISMYQPLSNIC